MVKLPLISGKDLIKALEKAGFQKIRQKGSHVSLQKGFHQTVIPLHDELARGTIFAILKQCGISKEELIELMKR